MKVRIKNKINNNKMDGRNKQLATDYKSAPLHFDYIEKCIAAFIIYKRNEVMIKSLLSMTIGPSALLDNVTARAFGPPFLKKHHLKALGACRPQVGEIASE